jgi:hypothetical protein
MCQRECSHEIKVPHLYTDASVPATTKIGAILRIGTGAGVFDNSGQHLAASGVIRTVNAGPG